MAKVHVTSKGTKLNVMSLKGKDYMVISERLVWFEEENKKYIIEPQALDIKDDYAIFSTLITILDDNGNIVRKARASKREDKKSFPDYLEKAETGSMGRCLALLGYGTQFAAPDLDEGERLADAPIVPRPSDIAKITEVNAKLGLTVDGKGTFKPSKKEFKEPVKSAPAEIEPKVENAKQTDGW